MARPRGRHGSSRMSGTRMGRYHGATPRPPIGGSREIGKRAGDRHLVDATNHQVGQETVADRAALVGDHRPAKPSLSSCALSLGLGVLAGCLCLAMPFWGSPSTVGLGFTEVGIHLFELTYWLAFSLFALLALRPYFATRWWPGWCCGAAWERSRSSLRAGRGTSGRCSRFPWGSSPWLAGSQLRFGLSLLSMKKSPSCPSGGFRLGSTVARPIWARQG